MTTPADSSRFGGNSNPSRPAAEKPSGGGNFFTRKLGPLPMWGWLAIGTALLIIVYVWKQNKAASSAGNSITPPGSSPDQTTAASQIPQFVNITDVGTQTAPPTTSPTGGPKPVNGVPNLVGMSHDSAMAAARNVGMTVAVDLLKGQHINRKEGYTVTSQNPPPGAQVQPGEKVEVHLEQTKTYDRQKKEGKLKPPTGQGWSNK